NEGPNVYVQDDFGNEQADGYPADFDWFYGDRQNEQEGTFTPNGVVLPGDVQILRNLEIAEGSEDIAQDDLKAAIESFEVEGTGAWHAQVPLFFNVDDADEGENPEFTTLRPAEGQTTSTDGEWVATGKWNDVFDEQGGTKAPLDDLLDEI